MDSRTVRRMEMDLQMETLTVRHLATHWAKRMAIRSAKHLAKPRAMHSVTVMLKATPMDWH
jgi:predicted nucleic acid-binding Zn ribbon protein